MLHRLFRLVALICALPFLSTCTEPVVPVYQFETGFLLVEGRITDTDGYNEIRISRNELLFGDYTLVPQDDAVVSVIDDEGTEVIWDNQPGTGVYRAPLGWEGQSGRSYQVRAVTPEGEIIESAIEPMPTAVPIEEASISFEQEAYFSVGRDRFIPAFFLEVDVEDPGDEENFYQYRYTTYQTIAICASCERARWRDGECIPGPDTRFVPRWDYLCDSDCWVFANGSGINVLSDEFSNGQRISNIPAGRFDFDRPGGLLFDLQQYNISRAAYEYALTLRDLAEGAGGLNAPLPAALVGNLSDVSELETPILGFVGVSAVDIERVFIDRDTVQGESLPYQFDYRPEPVMPTPPQAPCVGFNRTTVEPEGWVR